MAWRGDLTVNLVITTLIICGGLGFLVLSEIVRRRRRAALSVHTKFALTMTAILLVGGTLAHLRARAPATRARSARSAPARRGWRRTSRRSRHEPPVSTPSTSARLPPPTLFLVMLLMFIGASPGGTGGGVKTTTFGITMAALWATVRGQNEPVLFRRRLTADLVARAFFISLIAFLALNAIALAGPPRGAQGPAGDALRDHVGVRHGRPVDEPGGQRCSASPARSRPSASCLKW